MSQLEEALESGDSTEVLRETEPEPEYNKTSDIIVTPESSKVCFLAGNKGGPDSGTLDDIARYALLNLKIWEEEYGHDLDYNISKNRGNEIVEFSAWQGLGKIDYSKNMGELSVHMRAGSIDFDSEEEYHRLISCFKVPMEYHLEGETNVEVWDESRGKL